MMLAKIAIEVRCLTLKLVRQQLNQLNAQRATKLNFTQKEEHIKVEDLFVTNADNQKDK